MAKWATKKIKDIASTHSGGTPLKWVKENWNGSIPWVKSGELNDNLDITSCTESISEHGIAVSPAKILPKGTILISMYGSITGKLGILGMKAATNHAICAIENTQSLFNERFMFYYLLYTRDKIRSNRVGGWQSSIKKSYIENIEIPLPSLEVQNQIVAKLENIFDKIDLSKMLLQENIQSAKELMDSMLDEMFANGDTKVSEACIVNPHKREVKSKLDESDLVSFVPMNVISEDCVDFNPCEEKRLLDVYEKYTYFMDNDVLIARVNPCFPNKKAGIAKRLKNGIGFGTTEVHVLRPNGKVLPEWLYFALQSSKFIEYGKLNYTGSSRLKRVPKKVVADFKIPVPPIDIQEDGVEKLLSLQLKLNSLKQEYVEKVANLEVLKLSVLDKAFKGDV